MPLVNMQIMEGRPESKINDLIKNVTETVSETLDSPKENVRVIIHEVPKTHWGIGGVRAVDKNR
ncbi:MAG TPA: 4-oxalocrotonate tautomerase [Virgibacillus sp.]|nr:4-oxalocrotonate tautomerase [Virgibacillus sp.]HLR68285.1 4-oxalocrotonate tautomerase [Virgibacillus sp.]